MSNLGNFGVKTIMWILQERMQNKIDEYIPNQLKEDELGEQLSITEASPFKSRK